jgi:integrase
MGAGLTGGEIGEVRQRDISVDENGVLVHVAGNRPRTVPVLAEWEAALCEVARSSRDPETFLFRPDAHRPAPNVINHFTKKDGQPPSTNRMRTTWIVEHLAASVPAKALLDAAGVQGFASFERCVAYLPDVDLAAVRSLLRGSGAPRA